MEPKPPYYSFRTGKPKGSTARKYDAKYRSDRADGVSHPDAFKAYKRRRMAQHRARVRHGYLDPLPKYLGVVCGCDACSGRWTGG